MKKILNRLILFSEILKQIIKILWRFIKLFILIQILYKIITISLFYLLQRRLIIFKIKRCFIYEKSLSTS